MNLKSYNEFLFESFLLTSDYLSDIIKSIDDPVAQKFSELINKDVKTKYNLIDLTDTNDKLAFMPDSQASLKLKSGLDPIDLFKNLPNNTTIGRVVRGILKDNGIEFTEKEIERFVNNFKSAYDAWKMKSEKKEQIRVVRGEDIRFWYSEKNYCQETLNGKGSLGKSCMRYLKCQGFLDIYVNNPEEVGLVIYLDDQDKLKSRALLWNTDKGLALDRIYYTDDSDHNLLENWVKSNFDLPKSSFNKKIVLTGKSNSDGSYDNYPYMDQFMYYYLPEKTLYNYEPSVNDIALLLQLQDTNGSGLSMDLVYCEIEDESHPSSMVVWSDYCSSYMHRDNAVYSEYESDYIWADDACYSEALRDNLISDKSVSVFLDENNKNRDWYPEDHENIFLDLATDDYYIKDLAIEDDEGTLTLSRNIITVYEVERDSIDKFKKLYNIDSNYSYYYATINDEKIFDIKLNKEHKRNLYNKTYFESYWSMTILDKIDDLIKDLDFELKYDKEKELEQADEILSKTNKLFNYRNQMYRMGGEKELMSKWQTSVIDDSNLSDERIKDLIKWTTRYTTTRTAIFKTAADEIENFDSKFINLIKEILQDPRQYFLAFLQTKQIENSKQLQDRFILKFKKLFDFQNSNKMTFDSFFPVLQHFIPTLIKELPSSISYTTWFKVFDYYLRNQNHFLDLKQ